MAKVNGATITSESKIMGRSVTSMSGIMGVKTRNIPGWPSAASGPTNISPPDIFANISPPLLWNNYGAQASRGIWTGTGDISYLYKWFSNGELISTQGPYPYVDSKGNINDSPPTIMVGPSVMFTTLELQVTATDDLGSTTVSTSAPVEDANLNTFLANSGISAENRVAALQYLQKELIVGGILSNNSANLDYYPFAGEDEYQNKWSLGNPSEYLQFSGSWSHSANGSQTNGGIATSTKTFNNEINNLTWAYGMYTNTNVTESSIDLSFNTIYGNWEFGAQRDVEGARKVYWTRPGGTIDTSISSVSSTGLSGLYRYGQNPPNEMIVISGGTVLGPVSFGGVFEAARGYTFVIGGTGSTKNFQFAFNGNNFVYWGPLKTILENYNTMLGR